MRIAITGGAGFLGSALARRLLTGGDVAVGGAAPAPLTELLLADLVPPPADLAEDLRVTVVVGDLIERLPELGDPDLVLHLAGVVSGAAEADFDLGMRGNVDTTRALIDHCRRLPVPPVVVFSSSVAVFGSDPARGAVGAVDDDTMPRPQSSYGAQKLMCEVLLADATRRGFVRGRSVRLMTVAVRPGRPNAAASSFVSGIVREPLAGLPAVCPVPPDTPIVLSSPRRTLDGLVLAAAVEDGTWGSTTAMNLPALTTTPRQMAAALDRVAGRGTSELIEWTDDPSVAAIVSSWPARVTAGRAEALGLAPESSFDDIIHAYLQDQQR
jgi:nucleoside-diphosphate-sugar epimerase